MDRRSFLAAAGTAALGSLAGCSSVLGAGEPDYDVGMTGTDFVPEVLHVTVGTEVVWYNNSSRGHTVTAYEDGIPEDAAYFATGGFPDEGAAREAFWAWRADPENIDQNGMLTNGESYRHTFEQPGSYAYVCLPHEAGAMVGSVVVEE